MNRRQKIRYLKADRTVRPNLSALNVAELNELLALAVKQEKGEAFTAEEVERINALNEKTRI